MRKTGILNAQLAWCINRLGHTDTFAIADCGLPVPDDVEVVDLAVVFGVPSFADVTRAILDEVIIEAVTVAQQCPPEVLKVLPEPIEKIDHEELKLRLAHCSFVVRTGETTPYANVIFRSAVPF